MPLAKIVDCGNFSNDNYSKVIDENGEPKVVWHAGTFTSDGNYVADGMMHFGTKKAAIDRARTKFIEWFYPVYTSLKDGKYCQKYLLNTSSLETLPNLSKTSIPQLKLAYRAYL